MGNWKTFHSKEITLTPSAGSDVSDCVRDAVILALTEDCVVRFKHNGSEVTVDPKDVKKPFYEQWEASRK